MRDTGADRGLVSTGKRGSMTEIIGAEDNLRTYTFYFQMPELTSVNMGQSATAKASDYGTAFNRAWKEVKKRKGVWDRRRLRARSGNWHRRAARAVVCVKSVRVGSVRGAG